MESYSHIDLTDEELDEAILLAKRKKEKLIEKQKLEARAAENRKALTGTRWTTEQTADFMIWRAKQIFAPKEFVLDSHNKSVFQLLCAYFSSDDNAFQDLCKQAGIDNPSISKGLCLVGVYGTGKSWLMKLFQKNQRQVFFIRNAKQIANEYQSDGVEASSQYENLFKNPFNDPAVFFQPHSGLLIDDMGTESVKKHYGNESNVIGDLIELRYSKGFVGDTLHVTTNLTSDQIEQYYGGRVRSRMREIFNFIELPGNDRRI